MINEDLEEEAKFETDASENNQRKYSWSW